jgi:tight adherence protein B
MNGGSLADAVGAATAFVAAKAPADRVEIVGFADRAATLTGFSASETAAGSALATLTRAHTPGTALWDAVVLGSRQLAHEPGGGRVLVILTDGRDVSSSSSFADAVAAANSANVAVYPIGIQGANFTPTALQQLASQTGGAYHEAPTTKDLAAIYGSIGRELHPPSVWLAAWMPVAVAGAVGLLVLLACACWFGSRKGRWVRARLEPHLNQLKRSTNANQHHRRKELVQALLAATERAFANVKHFRVLQRLLERADLPLRAAELLYICIGSGVAAGFLAILIFGSPLLGLILTAVGAWLPVVFVKFKATARLKTFDGQLADILITISASLKAGHSFRHAIQSVVDEGAQPSAKEFSRVLTETQLGRPMDQALSDLAERVGSKNLAFVITAVTIQRQVGGSLAGLFDMVAETVRQRQQFHRKVRSLTAMGRASAYVLVALPFFIALAVTLLSPGYMAPLYHTSAGHTLLVAGLTMIAFGSTILKRMVAFKD